MPNYERTRFFSPAPTCIFSALSSSTCSIPCVAAAAAAVAVVMVFIHLYSSVSVRIERTFQLCHIAARKGWTQVRSHMLGPARSSIEVIAPTTAPTAAIGETCARSKAFDTASQVCASESSRLGAPQRGGQLSVQGMSLEPNEGAKLTFGLQAAQNVVSES